MGSSGYSEPCGLCMTGDFRNATQTDKETNEYEALDLFFHCRPFFPTLLDTCSLMSVIAAISAAVHILLWYG